MPVVASRFPSARVRNQSGKYRIQLEGDGKGVACPTVFRGSLIRSRSPRRGRSYLRKCCWIDGAKKVAGAAVLDHRRCALCQAALVDKAEAECDNQHGLYPIPGAIMTRVYLICPVIFLALISCCATVSGEDKPVSVTIQGPLSPTSKLHRDYAWSW